MKGHGIAEYVVILFLVVVVIAVIAVVGPSLKEMLTNDDVCYREPDSYECKKARVEACLQDEMFTKDQCVILVGGGD